MSSLKKNFVYQSTFQLLKILLPIVLVPYLSRTLGAEQVGIQSYTYTIANYFVVFSMLGLEQYGNRMIAKARDDKNELSKTFFELLLTHCLISSLCLIAYAIFVLCGPKEYYIITLIQGLYVISALFDISWFYFGIEKFKLTVTRDIVIKLITVSLVFMLVKKSEDLWKYCLIIGCGTLLGSIALWFSLPKYAKLTRVTINDCKKHIKPLLTLFIAVVAAHIYRMIDKVMLGSYKQLYDLGCYEYADKIVRIPLGLITALGTIMISRMSNLFAKNQKAKIDEILNTSALLVMFMSIGMSFGLAAIAPEFIEIFLGDGYDESVVLLCFLSTTIPLIAWNNYIRTQILIPLQKDMIYTKAVVTGALINVILNVFLIRFYGARGAAIATIISYMAVLAIQTLPVLRIGDIKRNFKHFPAFVVSGVVMYFIVRVIGGIMGASIITVLLEILVGTIVYVAITLTYMRIKGKSIRDLIGH